MATWYAQKTANIDSVSAGTTSDVWNASADGSGPWMDISVLTAGGTDTVLAAHSNTTAYTIYIRSNIDIGTGYLSTMAEGAAVQGGEYICYAVTITANVRAGTTKCLSVGPGASALTGDVSGGSGTAAHGVMMTNSEAVLVLTGNVVGGSALLAHGISVTTGTLTVYGGVTGGSYSGTNGMSAGIALVGAGSVTINGTVTGGTRWPGAWGFAGPITVIGSLVDSSTCAAYDGAIYWQPASMAHYHQTPWNGSYNFRYTVPPMAQNVRDGVQRGYMLEFPDNGTLQIPAEADVKLGVGYGGGGTEFEGTLAAGGGGVPLIGPGGLVG